MSKVCSQCGDTWESTFASALMATLGARLSWDPNKCRKGKKALKMRHEWAEVPPSIEVGKEA